MSTAVRPPVPYFGSKGRIAPWIASLLPDHGHYVEPFCGGLSVLLAKEPSKLETVSDLDGELMTFWRVLRDRPADLLRACALTPHSRAEQAAAYEPSTDDLETARRVWVRLTQGRGGTLRRTGWRQYIDPAGTATSLPGCLDGYADRLAAAAERLHAVSLESLPALDLIERYGKHTGTLLYIDPPYLGSTRSFANYRHEMRGEEQHRELAAALADCRATVVLSGYHSPLYDELYDGWHRYETAARADNAKASRERTEVLWANRPLSEPCDDPLDLFATA
jgi:DNA adenine methylase